MTIINEYDIDCIFKDFDCVEHVVYYYDSDPPECKNCNNDSCQECQYRIKYNKSKKQLSFNNCIDIQTLDMWDMTQKTMNENIKDFLLCLIKEGREKDIHQFFIVQSEDPEKEFMLYLYYRNINNCDDYYMFKRK